LTLLIGFCRRDFPLSGLLLLAQVFDVDTSISGEVRVNLGPLFVDGSIVIVLELDTLAVDLSRVEVKVDVRMIGVAVNCGEGDRPGEGLLKELIGEIPDLLIGCRHIKREFDLIVSASSLGYRVDSPKNIPKLIRCLT
jgi:hypothetical protein